ncbi:MAG TPA: hypothetical protein DCZ92_09910 [Elusimicrobia bacterium]|nr:MAG: hypothetical protein A2016_05275 [Elusimicrobia bacterium GWF2_62_30]HBA61115.1 hypothetical protein [Elusimicrobiota bacterium]
MNFKVCLASLLLLAAALPAAAKEPPMKIKARLADAARYEVPQGSTETFVTNQGDPQAVLARDLHKIKVRLSGGKGSRYKTSGDFMAGFEVLSKGGKKAEKAGPVLVSGERVMLFSREVAVSLPAPDTGGPSIFGKEEFCVVPYGKQFFVLSYAYGDSIPDPSYDGLAAWRQFLKTFRLVKEAKAAK